MISVIRNAYQLFSRIKFLNCLITIIILCFSSNAYSQTETHPFIIYKLEDVQMIKDRLAREPYTSWFNRLVLLADTVLGDGISWDKTTVPEETKAYYAKLFYFVYAFTDSSEEIRNNYGTEAALSLYHMPSNN